MGKTKLSKPLLFQSKQLFFSLLYLFTTLFLAFYTNLSPSSKCLFNSSPFDPIQSSLFSYPPSYGAHKYAVPTSRSTCSHPVNFSDYWLVVKEIQDLCQNSSSSSSSSQGLRYIQAKADTFGGNFTSSERFSFLDHSDDSFEVPCGFFKPFPISNSDQAAMERCNGVVVISAIFNDHDKVRQPKSLGTSTRYNVCFFMFVDDITLEKLEHHQLISRKSNVPQIGVWRLVKVQNQNLYESPAMNGVIPKYLVHRFFPYSKYSIWIDAKLQLMVDPLLLIHALVVKENVDMAVSKHPFFKHTMEDAMATARWKKWWDIDGLRTQMETYCENGLQPWSLDKPYPSDVPDSALILRKHGLSSNLFSCLMFNELEGFNPRDQLAFAYIRDKMKTKMKMNMFEVEVFEQVALEYRHNLKKHGDRASGAGGSEPRRNKRVYNDLFENGSCCGRCQNYVYEMWGESHS